MSFGPGASAVPVHAAEGTDFGDELRSAHPEGAVVVEAASVVAYSGETRLGVRGGGNVRDGGGGVRQRGGRCLNRERGFIVYVSHKMMKKRKVPQVKKRSRFNCVVFGG